MLFQNCKGSFTLGSLVNRFSKFEFDPISLLFLRAFTLNDSILSAFLSVSRNVMSRKGYMGKVVNVWGIVGIKSLKTNMADNPTLAALAILVRSHKKNVEKRKETQETINQYLKKRNMFNCYIKCC